MGKTAELDTIWEVPDGLWAEIKRVLDELAPPKKTGRPRADGSRICLPPGARQHNTGQ